MDRDTKKISRIVIFLSGCIVSRLGLTYLSKIVDKKWLRRIGIVTLIPAFGFILIYLFGLRKTGGEVFGDKIWWNNLRPIHGFLYLLFSILAIIGYNKSWIILLIDTLFGLLMFSNYHINNR